MSNIGLHQFLGEKLPIRTTDQREMLLPGKLRLESYGTRKAAKGLADRRIIVDDDNGRLWWAISMLNPDILLRNIRALTHQAPCTS